MARSSRVKTSLETLEPTSSRTGRSNAFDVDSKSEKVRPICSCKAPGPILIIGLVDRQNLSKLRWTKGPLSEEISKLDEPHNMAGCRAPKCPQKSSTFSKCCRRRNAVCARIARRRALATDPLAVLRESFFDGRAAFKVAISWRVTGKGRKLAKKMTTIRRIWEDLEDFGPASVLNWSFN